jgi:hypothetical protein
MPNRFSSGKFSIAQCDRCGFRFKLQKLKSLTIKTKRVNILVCPECWEQDHPQLQLGMYPISDPQAIRDPRPDTNTWLQSGTNTLGFPGEGMLTIQWGWNPIGGSQGFDAALTPNTLVGRGEVGTVTI